MKDLKEIAAKAAREVANEFWPAPMLVSSSSSMRNAEAIILAALEEAQPPIPSGLCECGHCAEEHSVWPLPETESVGCVSCGCLYFKPLPPAPEREK